MNVSVTAKKIGFYVALIAVWQLVTMTSLWPENIFPSPYSVIEDLYYMAVDTSIFYGIGTSLYRLGTGFGIAAVGGLMLGIFMAKVKTVDDTIGSLVLGLQSIPSVAWVPLAILWFGLTDAGIIFVTAIGAVFAVALSTSSGVKNINPDYIEAAQNMGARGQQLVIRLLLPAAFPYMISGLKQGWAFAWRGVIGAELLFSFLGLGFLLTVGRQLNDISQIMGVMIIIMAIGIVIDGFVFKKVEDNIMARWGLR